jgi:hypothetical protein
MMMTSNNTIIVRSINKELEYNNMLLLFCRQIFGSVAPDVIGGTGMYPWYKGGNERPGFTVFRTSRTGSAVFHNLL